MFIEFLMVFKESGASVGRRWQPSAPWGWVLNDEKVVFRVGRPSKTGSVSRPPSAAIGAHRRPLGGS